MKKLEAPKVPKKPKVTRKAKVKVAKHYPPYALHLCCQRCYMTEIIEDLAYEPMTSYENDGTQIETFNFDQIVILNTVHATNEWEILQGKLLCPTCVKKFKEWFGIPKPV